MAGGTTGCGLLPPGCLNHTGTLWAGSVALGAWGSPTDVGRLCRRASCSHRVSRTKSASFWGSPGGPVRWELQRDTLVPRGADACPGSPLPAPWAPTLRPWLLAALPCGRVYTSCARMPAPRVQGVWWAPLEPQRVTGVCWGLNPAGGMSSKENTPPHPAPSHTAGAVRGEQLEPPACRAISGLTFVDCVAGLQHAIRVRSAFSLRCLMIHAENVIKISR